MFKDPAFGSEFFDREKVTATLMKRVEAFREGYHQNMGLIGKPSIGKSSILQNFVLTMRYSDIIPIYIEVSQESFEDFAHRFMGMVLAGYFQSLGKNIPHEIEIMLKAARRELPRTTKKMAAILKMLKRVRHNDVFYELFSLCLSLADETEKKIVLVIDEFSLFDQFGLKDPYVAFGKQIMVQKNTMFIVASSLIKGAYEIFNEKLSLLFGNFEVVKVKPFDFKTAYNFIRSRAGDACIPQPLMRFLIWITDGHPYYLSVLLKRMRLQKREEATDGAIKQVVLDALEDEMFFLDGQLSRYFSLYFASLFSTKKSCYMNALVAIALGRRKVKEIAQFIEKKTPEVKKILVKLVSEEIVEKNGNFYCINDQLLCLWLRYTYNVRRVSLRINKAVLNTEFKRYLGSVLQEFVDAEKKDIFKRMEELFLSFQNDVLEISNVRQKLPVFTQVSGDVAPGWHVLYARATHCAWTCYIANREITEDDVRAMIDERKKTKIKKSIIVIPFGIDMNAKLIAKEARFTLWRLKDINYLFSLYNKPKFIAVREEEPLADADGIISEETTPQGITREVLL